MRVVVDTLVHEKIEQFYNAALSLHIALDEEVVQKKKRRMYAALEELGNYPSIYPIARVRRDWIVKGYQEFICEDFHFAYQVCLDEADEPFVWVRDAVHSLLNVSERRVQG